VRELRARVEQLWREVSPMFEEEGVDAAVDGEDEAGDEAADDDVA
jgi:hypothetical protein